MAADNSTIKKQLHRFRMAGIAEGISFLVLLLIAMPLKYIFHIPAAVKFTGWAHGALFVTYLVLALEVYGSLNKKFFWLLKAIAAAFIPTGTFIFDKSLKRDAAVLEKSNSNA